jgi:hypothetical protein
MKWLVKKANKPAPAKTVNPTAPRGCNLMKRFTVLAVLMTVLVIPSMLFAANKVAVGEASVTNGTVTVPIVISNTNGLMAMDLPLKFSDGVVLKEVSFENTRASYFDLKIADIDNENHTVAIGLITQITATPKAELADGEGAVANLIFEVVNDQIDGIKLEAIKTTKPDHELMFIYQNRDGEAVTGQTVLYPEFEDIAVSFSNTVLPTEYGLSQNYPNPFNPTTTINFSLANAGDYNLTIFNVLGQTVQEYSGFSEAAEVSIEWNASNVSSGVYFYKLSAGDYSATKKMMLIK